MHEFLQIIDQLATWKFLPSGKDRAVLALSLAEWCDGRIERAEWLLTQRDGFDDYPGPATLRKLIKDKFQPAGALANYVSKPEVLPPVSCSTCSDTGTVFMNGKHAWCSCAAAQSMRTEMPNWIEFSNEYRGTKASRLAEEIRSHEARKKLEHLEAGYGTER